MRRENRAGPAPRAGNAALGGTRTPCAASPAPGPGSTISRAHAPLANTAEPASSPASRANSSPKRPRTDQAPHLRPAPRLPTTRRFLPQPASQLARCTGSNFDDPSWWSLYVCQYMPSKFSRFFIRRRADKQAGALGRISPVSCGRLGARGPRGCLGLALFTQRGWVFGP